MSLFLDFISILIESVACLWSKTIVIGDYCTLRGQIKGTASALFVIKEHFCS